MQGVRELLRASLGRSLRSLPDEDRLAAAWTVACGPALAERAEVLGLDENRVLHVRVLQPAWRDQFAHMRAKLTDELRRIAGVRLETIHFEEDTPKRAQNARTVTADGSGAERRRDRRKI